MTPSTQPRSACQEKGNFGDGISSIFFICVRSWAAVSLPVWSGAKNLVRQPEKKHFRGTHLQDPKGYHIWERACVNIPTPVSIGKVLQQEGGKKGCFVCLHCLLRESRMPHILELPSLFVYLFTYGQQKDFSFIFPWAGEESEIRFS